MAQVRTVLNDAAFGGGTPASERQVETLIERGQVILSRAAELAAGGEEAGNGNN